MPTTSNGAPNQRTSLDADLPSWEMLTARFHECPAARISSIIRHALCRRRLGPRTQPAAAGRLGALLADAAWLEWLLLHSVHESCRFALFSAVGCTVSNASSIIYNIEPTTVHVIVHVSPDNAVGSSTVRVLQLYIYSCI